MKVRATLGQIMLHHPQVAKRYENGDVMLAAARELGDSVSFRLITATRRLAEIDRDNEAEFDAAALDLMDAEAEFLRTHENTEVAL
jgi:hypothetical protein